MNRITKLYAPLTMIAVLAAGTITGQAFTQDQKTAGPPAVKVRPLVPAHSPAPGPPAPDPAPAAMPPLTAAPPPLPSAGAQPRHPPPPAMPPSQPEAAGVTAPGGPPGAARRAVPAGKRSGGGPPISLNFDDADVYQVIQTIFGDVLRTNYVVDGRVKGRVTFRSIAPVPRERVLPVMEVILRLNGIGVVEDAGLYRIIPISEIAREPTPIAFGRDVEKIPLEGKSLVQVIPVLYLQSSEMVKLITPFLSANAFVVDIPKTNQIIVVDTDASVKRIMQLVNALDNEQQKRKQAQVFVHHVQNGKARNAAALLQQIFLGAQPGQAAAFEASRPGTGPGGTAAPLPAHIPGQPASHRERGAIVSDITRIFHDEAMNALIILATPEDYALIRETVRQIDIVPRQVVIEGIIAEVMLTDNLSIGLSASVDTTFHFAANKVDGTLSLNPSGLDPAKLPGSGFTFVGKVGDRVRAVVSALATKSRAKVLAAPHILVADNREARIQVGQQVPVATSETFGSTTVAPQRTIQYKDIGVILKVTPQVNESGLVSLALAQEVSTFSTIELFSNEKNIIINKTEASTNLVVQDGETIVIGGLIREDTTRSITGIPWLSKIPLLGHLFGNTTDDLSRTEIIILLTPHVMKNQGDAKKVTDDYVDKFTATGKHGIKKDEINKMGTNQKNGTPEAGSQAHEEFEQEIKQ